MNAWLSEFSCAISSMFFCFQMTQETLIFSSHVHLLPPLVLQRVVFRFPWGSSLQASLLGHASLSVVYLWHNYIIGMQFPREKTEKVMAPHSSTLAWKIPWTEEPGGLHSMGSRRVGHDWVTSLSLFTFMIGEGNGNPLQCSCLENPRDGGAWWAAVYGVAQSQTQLMRFSSSRDKKGRGVGRVN